MADRIKKLIRLLNCIVVFIPLAMAAILSVVYICGGWGSIIEGHSPGFYFLEPISNLFPCVGITLLWAAAVLAGVFCLWKIQKYIKGHKARKLCICAAICLLAFGVRFLVLYIYSDCLAPFSDFGAAWERAKGNMEGGSINYYSLFPAYLNFSMYEGMVIKLLGESYVNVLYLNAFYSGLTASLLYLIAGELTDNVFICIFTGVAYALYPSNVIYITTGTPEFLAVLFNTLGIFIFLKAFREGQFRCKCIKVLAGGAALGIGGSFKTFSIVMVIALVLVTIADSAVKNNAKAFKAVLPFIIIAVLGAAGYRAASGWILDKTSKHFGIEISSGAAVPHFLLIGLNTEAEGQIHVGTLSRLYYQEYLANGMDYEAAKTYAYGVLKNDWGDNPQETIPNFAKKMIWAWQDDYIPVSYFKSEAGIKPDTWAESTVYNFICKYAAGVTELAYLLLLILALLGAASYAGRKEIDFRYEFIVLVIFGYFCMIFLSEAQSRYKCLVMGYVIVLSGIGTETVRKAFAGLKTRTGKGNAV